MIRYILFFCLFLCLPFNYNFHSENVKTLQLVTISIGGYTLEVELADTPIKRQTGLMYRESLDSDRGMLFVFPDSNYRTFWMKNTYIPLSIAFVTEGKVISDLYDMKPKQTDEVYPSSVKVMYAIEVNQGWYDKRNIKKGAKVVIPKNIIGM